LCSLHVGRLLATARWPRRQSHPSSRSRLLTWKCVSSAAPNVTTVYLGMWIPRGLVLSSLALKEMTLPSPISICQARLSHWRIASLLRCWLAGLTPRRVRESEPGDRREYARRGDRPWGTRSWRQYPRLGHREKPRAARRPGVGHNPQRPARNALPIHATHPPVDPWKSGGAGRIPARLGAKASPRRMGVVSDLRRVGAVPG